MSKFNTVTTRPAVSSPVVTEAQASGVNAYGGPGHARDVRSELFLLAVSNMVAEKTFHEAAGDRDARFVALVRTATSAHPDWTAAFLRWLRSDGNMRSASLVGAAEFARQALADKRPGARQVIASVLQRADEPGEMLAYWTSQYGRAIPKPVKRGVADAVVRLYDERSLLKYDAAGKGYRFSDVLDLTHPEATETWRGDLFAHALDRRHGRDNPIPETLAMLRARADLMALPVSERRAALSDPDGLKAAGMTWEALAGWLQGPMDAQAWAAVIPSMGYMALLRNLRNFDEAGVSDDVAEKVAARLSDPEQVARSRQFPFRFLSAYRATQSLRWGHPLEKALAASLANVPALTGRTLVLIDRSPSMFPGYGHGGLTASGMSRADQAAVFGCALALRASAATVAIYGGESREVAVPKGGALLRFVDGLGDPISYTDTAGAVRSHYAGHDRILIITDEQTATGDVAGSVPAHIPVYTWNLGGYRLGHGPSGMGQRHTFGGLTDAAFRLVPLLESGRNGDWPWVRHATA